MNGLLLHCGAEPLTRDQISAIPTPPAMGTRHAPYPYGDFIEHVHDALTHVGLRVKEEAYGALKDGGRMFGLMHVDAMTPTTRDFGLMVGLRGSHDQSMSRGLAVGSRVFVCDNLCFSGEAKVQTKQTLRIADRLPGLVMDAVETIPGLFEVQDARFDAYRNTNLKPRWGDAALIELVRRQAILPSQLGHAIREWDEPSHEEHAAEGRTLWRLHNAVTEAIKVPVDPDTGRPTRPAVMGTWHRTVPMTRFFDSIAKFEAGDAIAAIN